MVIFIRTIGCILIQATAPQRNVINCKSVARVRETLKYVTQKEVTYLKLRQAETSEGRSTTAIRYRLHFTICFFFLFFSRSFFFPSLRHTSLFVVLHFLSFLIHVTYISTITDVTVTSPGLGSCVLISKMINPYTT